MSSFRHVGINAVFLRPRMGGIETYVRRLTPELLALRPDVTFSLFVSREGLETVRDEPWTEQVALVAHPLLGIPNLRAASEMTLLTRIAAGRGVDLLHSVAMTGPLRARQVHVLTVADLNWVREPASVPRVTGWIWRRFVPTIARRADRVLTYSQAARRDVVDLLAIPEQRVDAVPLGPGAAPAPVATPQDELRQRLELGPGRLVLALSGKRPGKNVDTLIGAMPEIAARVSDAVLVLPGAHTPYEEHLRRLAAERGVSERIRFLGHVSTADLEGLYRAAECFAFPSTHEGFGLPVLEAMRRGVPVACSSASSLPEVAGDAARYFDPHRPDDLAAAVIELLTDRDLAARLAAAGRNRQRAFTWRVTAEGTLQCYERAWDARVRASR